MGLWGEDGKRSTCKVASVKGARDVGYAAALIATSSRTMHDRNSKGSFPQISKPQILGTTLTPYIVHHNLSKGSIPTANNSKYALT
jgi:hypothetical protein